MEGASRPRRRLLPALALALAGCSTPQEAKSPAELLKENSSTIRALASYDARERMEAIRTFKSWGRQRGTAVALLLLQDPKLEDYRLEAVLAGILASWEDQRAVPYLLQALRHPDQGVASIAAEQLLVFKTNVQVREVLSDMVKSPVLTERRRAAGVLSRIGGPQTAELFGELYKGETDAEVRGDFLVAIAASRHPRRKDSLITALTDDDEALRELAWSMLRNRYRDLPAVEYRANDALEARAQAIAELRLWAAAPPAARAEGR
jgi:hypothetical protein